MRLHKLEEKPEKRKEKNEEAHWVDRADAVHDDGCSKCQHLFLPQRRDGSRQEMLLPRGSSPRHSERVLLPRGCGLPVGGSTRGYGEEGGRHHQRLQVVGGSADPPGYGRRVVPYPIDALSSPMTFKASFFIPSG